MLHKRLEQIKSKLFSYQVAHVEKSVNVLIDNNALLDSSDTGTGKSYIAAAVCHIMILKPIVICPKIVISTWVRVFKYFGIEPFFIVNYESLRNFKFYNGDGDRVRCPYITKNPNYDLKCDDNEFYGLHNREISSYNFNLSDDKLLFIFDEAHRASRLHTQNGQLLFAAKLTNIPIMLLSATIVDDKHKFTLFSWILNFISSNKKELMRYPYYIRLVSKIINAEHRPLRQIHKLLYPSRAVRLKISDLGDIFPDNQIIAEPYTAGKKVQKKIDKQYKIILKSLDDLQSKSSKDRGNILVKMLRAHQKIELLKIPIFIELTRDFINSGKSVVIFVNFSDSLKILGKILKVKTFICGDQTLTEREKSIKNFNDNNLKIIICNIKAGGVGVSLHDTNGNFPRASIISPCWSSTDLVQSLGRIHRAGGKSKCIQRIVYISGTIEDKIAKKLNEKMLNLNDINNGGLKDSLIEIYKPIKKS
jgi:superfamily II DNA or RNA helicase